MKTHDEETTVPTTKEEDREWAEAVHAGPLHDRWLIHCEFADEPLTFDEWLNH